VFTTSYIILLRYEWVNPFTHVNERGWVSDCVSWMCLCVSERELTSSFVFMSERENSLRFRPSVQSHVGRTDGHTRFSVETLNPKPRHTQKDTHYTEWYPLRTHPRGYPLHWVIPWHWGKPITLSDTDTLSSQNPPKSSPIRLRDPVFLTNRPDTEWYPWHWGIPLTMSDTQYLGWERTTVW